MRLSPSRCCCNPCHFCVVLKDEGTGAAIAGATVVFQKNVSSVFTTVATVVTDSDGRACTDALPQSQAYRLLWTITGSLDGGVHPTFTVGGNTGTDCAERTFWFCQSKFCVDWEDCVSGTHLDLCWASDGTCVSALPAGTTASFTAGIDASIGGAVTGNVAMTGGRVDYVRFPSATAYPFCMTYFRLRDSTYTVPSRRWFAVGQKSVSASNFCDLNGRYVPGCWRPAVVCNSTTSGTVGLYPYGYDYSSPALAFAVPNTGCVADCNSASPVYDSACTPTGLIKKSLILRVFSNDTYNTFGSVLGGGTSVTLECDPAPAVAGSLTLSACLTQSSGGLTFTSGGVYSSCSGWYCSPFTVPPGPTVHAFASTKIEMIMASSGFQLRGFNYTNIGCANLPTPCAGGFTFQYCGNGRQWAVKTITTYNLCTPTLIEGTLVSVDSPGDAGVAFSISES